jgi:hypothetical protein
LKIFRETALGISDLIDSKLFTVDGIILLGACLFKWMHLSGNMLLH